MTNRTTEEENAALRLVIAQHDQYLTGMVTADPRGADQSDYLNASFDLYGRLEDAGFGNHEQQQAFLAGQHGFQDQKGPSNPLVHLR